ncbi:DUF1003 domain-containing protein [Deinococcus alpinitundrae]|uniref:DUF1003 domain-containing protein n=1 Tax=Deinococcus alpinitundrae TaxID=468913 RepID=UPI00137B16AD|nr:DUF1003 domain-containing protein [Deinococcus alpinitundrae]
MRPAPETAGPVCAACHRRRSDLVPLSVVRLAVGNQVQAAHPDVQPSDQVCLSCLNLAISDEIDLTIQQDQSEFAALNEEALLRLSQQEAETKNLNAEYDKALPLGARMADRVARFGGSWLFIGLFIGVLILWIGVNALHVLIRPFDPYPFILLNLVLSTVAAMQAPVILMSQNRLEARDRLQAQQDYEVNLKAELELRHLHAKIDHLTQRQWQHLLVIQQAQMDLMREVADRDHRD